MKNLKTIIFVISLLIFYSENILAEEKSLDLLKVGYDNLNAGDVKGARIIFQKLVDEEPGLYFDATEGLAWCLVNEGRFEQAVEYAKIRLRKNKDKIDETWFPKYLEILRLSPVHRSEAIENYKSYIEKNPNDLKMKEYYAETLSWDASTQALSAQIFKELIALDKTNSIELRFKYARQVLNSGQLVEAIGLFSQLVQDSPAPSHYLGLAQSYHWSGQIDKAAQIISEAIWQHPDDKYLLLEHQKLTKSAPNIFEVTESIKPEVKLLNISAANNNDQYRDTQLLSFKKRLGQNRSFRAVYANINIDDGDNKVDRQRINMDFYGRLSKHWSYNLIPGYSNSSYNENEFEHELRLQWGEAGRPIDITLVNKKHSLIDGSAFFSESEFNYILINNGINLSDESTLKLEKSESSVQLSFNRSGFFGHIMPGQISISDGNSAKQLGASLGYVWRPWLRFKWGYYSLKHDEFKAAYFSPEDFSTSTIGAEADWNILDRWNFYASIGQSKAIGDDASDAIVFSYAMKWSPVNEFNFILQGEVTNQDNYEASQHIFGFNFQF